MSQSSSRALTGSFSIAPYFDAVAVHAYGLTQSPDDPSGPDKLNFSRAEQVHALMERHGDGAKSVYITEGGWIPVEINCGSLKVERSITFAASNSTRSALYPGLIIPLSVIPRRQAGSDVIFRTASVSVSQPRVRENKPSTRGKVPAPRG